MHYLGSQIKTIINGDKITPDYLPNIHNQNNMKALKKNQLKLTIRVDHILIGMHWEENVVSE